MTSISHCYLYSLHLDISYISFPISFICVWQMLNAQTWLLWLTSGQSMISVGSGQWLVIGGTREQGCERQKFARLVTRYNTWRVLRDICLHYFIQLYYLYFHVNKLNKLIRLHSSVSRLCILCIVFNQQVN